MNSLNMMMIKENEFIPKTYDDVVQVDFYNYEGDEPFFSFVGRIDGNLSKEIVKASEITQFVACVKKESD